MPELNPSLEHEPDSAPPAAGGWNHKLKAIGVIAAIVLAECVIALLLLPSADDAAALAQAQRVVESSEQGVRGEEPPPPRTSGRPMQEVDLGRFSVSAYQPLSNTTLRIDFHLFGTVEDRDMAPLQAEMAKHNHRMREDVIVTVRSASIEDLTDAGLGLIKRQILDKTNRRLGKPYLKSIIFSDYSFLEQ